MKGTAFENRLAATVVAKSSWNKASLHKFVFLSSLVFLAANLPAGLLYWSVSRLPALLGSGVGGGWDWWRGEVIRGAPGRASWASTYDI